LLVKFFVPEKLAYCCTQQQMNVFVFVINTGYTDKDGSWGRGERYLSARDNAPDSLKESDRPRDIHV
jgi:hypothetical protein